MNPQPQIVIASEAQIKIHTLDDLPDVLGAMFGAEGLLLTEQELSPAFFDLKTGLAGEAFQKLTNYRIQTALVLENFEKYGERFSELVFEHQKHNLIRFFGSVDQAKTWLMQ
jgi:hypothetical protein